MPRAKRYRARPKREQTGRWFGYVRVSTAGQGLSVERQGHAINAEAIRRRVQVCVHADNGSSGRLPPDRRPGLREVLAELQQGRADGLIVAKLDRLGRSVADVADVVDRAMAQGWSLVVLDPALDLTTAAGRLTAHVLGAVAEMEAELVAERTAAIVEMKREQGKSLGGRPSQLPDNVVGRIVAEREQGATLQAIADGLNADGIPTGQGGAEWRPSSVAAVLKRKGQT